MHGAPPARKMLALAVSVEAEAVELRRRLHRRPEIGFAEVETTALIVDHLQRLGLDVVRPRGCTGAVARLVPAGAAGRRRAVALRADIDALPQSEETDLPFRSEIPGRAHLCGHDMHTAMLLAAARALVSARRRLPQPVTFVFQPAEECIPNGAPRMIAAGALERVGEIYALHVGPDRPVGTLAVRPGPMMAAMDRFDCTVTGSGGHGAMPHLCRDPVVAAAAVIGALQTVVARRVPPLDPAVVTVGTVEARGAFNVIPQRVRLSGTARSLSRDLHARLPGMIREVAAGTARAMGCRLRLRYSRGTPVLVNSAGCCARLAGLWKGLIAAGGALRLVENRPTMGGEDFAFYLEKVPGCMAFLGAAPRERGGTFHSPDFLVDERAMRPGIALHASLALGAARA